MPGKRDGGGHVLADMSLPPEARGRRRKSKGRGKGASKQMNHGTSPPGVKLRKEWERRSRRLPPAGLP